MPILNKFEKTPSEVLDYPFDLEPFLTDRNDAIQSAVISAEPGLTVGPTTITGSIVNAFISGGTDQTSYLVTCEVVTTGGRTVDGAIRLTVRATK